MKVPDRLDSVLAEITALNDGGWWSTWEEVIYYDIDASEWCHYAGSNTFNEHATVLRWKYCSEALNTNYQISDKNTHNLFSGMSLILSKYPESKSSIGIEGELSIYFEGKDTKLAQEDIDLLKRWKWKKYYPGNGFTYWSYE